MDKHERLKRTIGLVPGIVLDKLCFSIAERANVAAENRLEKVLNSLTVAQEKDLRRYKLERSRMLARYHSLQSTIRQQTASSQLSGDGATRSSIPPSARTPSKLNEGNPGRQMTTRSDMVAKYAKPDMDSQEGDLKVVHVHVSSRMSRHHNNCIRSEEACLQTNLFSRVRGHDTGSEITHWHVEPAVFPRRGHDKMSGRLYCCKKQSFSNAFLGEVHSPLHTSHGYNDVTNVHGGAHSALPSRHKAYQNKANFINTSAYCIHSHLDKGSTFPHIKKTNHKRLPTA